jgi:hypothetical protein
MASLEEVCCVCLADPSVVANVCSKRSCFCVLFSHFAQADWFVGVGALWQHLQLVHRTWLELYAFTVCKSSRRTLRDANKSTQ